MSLTLMIMLKALYLMVMVLLMRLCHCSELLQTVEIGDEVGFQIDGNINIFAQVLGDNGDTNYVP